MDFRKIKYCLMALPVLLMVLQAQDSKWGWDAHRFINDAAVDYLPAGMSFFREHQSYLSEHAPDPDRDDNIPKYYHYIDIDDYDEFFTGDLPAQWDSALALFGYSRLIKNGTVPWVVEEWADSLTALMARGEWGEVWQIAAELGHFVADSHQALHLTLNYNGQYSGNNGIHSRYETQMINPRLSELVLQREPSVYWESLIDSVFDYIEAIYPVVDMIMAADDLASQIDPDYGSTYYNALWSELDSVTTMTIQRAIADLASVWRTAWENAGRPTPPGYTAIAGNIESPPAFELFPNFPNPFNPATTIRYQLAKSSLVRLSVYDLTGRAIVQLIDEVQAPDFYQVFWNGTDQHGYPVSAGIYIARLYIDETRTTDCVKMVLIK